MCDLITDQTKGSTLGKFRDIPIKRTVFEVELKIVGDHFTTGLCDLLQISIGDDFAIDIPKRQEPEGHAFEVADRNGVSGTPGMLQQQNDARQKCVTEIGPDIAHAFARIFKMQLINRRLCHKLVIRREFA